MGSVQVAVTLDRVDARVELTDAEFDALEPTVEATTEAADPPGSA